MQEDDIQLQIFSLPGSRVIHNDLRLFLQVPTVGSFIEKTGFLQFRGQRVIALPLSCRRCLVENRTEGIPPSGY